MSNKIYLGNRLSDLDIGEPSMPISKVILNVDSEKYYQAGDDSGLTIEQDCPWATQAMADSILEKLQGFVYNSYSGSEALLDPAAELGDAITVGGLYGILSTIGRNLDRQGAATIGAPKVDEIEDEYPYKTKERKKTDRTLANVKSLISKTAEEIRLEVQSISGETTELKVLLDGVTVTDKTGTTKIKGSSIATDTLYVRAANITGSVTASELLGGFVGLLNEDEDIVGELGITGATTSNYAIDLTSYGALRFTAEYGNLYLGNESSGRNNFLVLDGNDVFMRGGAFYPTGAASDLGTGTKGAWENLFLYGEVSDLSDQNYKNSVEDLPPAYLDLFDALTPCRYKMNNGTSGRYHVGFIAQKVEAAIGAAGLDTQQFAGFIRAKDEETGTEICYLRYNEFIGILTAKIKQLEFRLAELEEK